MAPPLLSGPLYLPCSSFSGTRNIVTLLLRPWAWVTENLLSQFWRPGFQGQGNCRVGLLPCLWPWLSGAIFCPSLYVVVPVCVCVCVSKFPLVVWMLVLLGYSHLPHGLI
jgi:hypothetical protein